jgi:hypothetical protein
MPDMAGDPAARPLLPQTTQAQTFPFTPQVLGPPEPQQKSAPALRARSKLCANRQFARLCLRRRT